MAGKSMSSPLLRLSRAPSARQPCIPSRTLTTSSTLISHPPPRRKRHTSTLSRRPPHSLIATSTFTPTSRPFTTSHSTHYATIEDDSSFDPSTVDRESDSVDVLIIGAGPAGLSAAIRLKQLSAAAGNEDFRVVVLEKSSEIGGHILSGNVLEPRALNELLPDWNNSESEHYFPHTTPATKDRMRFLTAKGSFPLPAPPQMHNGGNYIISLSQFTKYLGDVAESLGVELYPGFAGAELTFAPDGSVSGVATNDLGLSRSGQPKPTFERGMEFNARVTLLAEGCHGSLTKKVCAKFDLRRESQPQTYGLGLKEVWEVLPEKHDPGSVSHSMGYPLSKSVYGGGWMYHYGSNLVSIGLVVGLDYANPWLSPYGEFQKMKLHPFYKSVLEGGKCLAYGARALNEGGFQSIPKCSFPGGALIGDSAGFLNVPKIKGTHLGMKSGMLAAESAFEAITGTRVSSTSDTSAQSSDPTPEQGPEQEVKKQDETIFLYSYEDALRSSWIWPELKAVRNMRPSFHTSLGIYGGIMYSGLEAYIFRGMVPWTLRHPKPDYAMTLPAEQCTKITYPKADGEITFDILTSVSRTGTNHEEDQPVHLQVKDWERHAEMEWPKYKGVENRFCPAGVYEYVEDESKELGVRFQINSQNCIHCKTCDIKDPSQDINWQVPQGGEGPKYSLT